MSSREGEVALGAKLLIGAALLVGLALLGHHVAHLLPELESQIDRLGPWAPLGLVLVIFVVTPFLVPDSIFGVAAGVLFGLWTGLAVYFAGTYLACVLVWVVTRGVLRERVTRWVSRSDRLAAILAAVRQQGFRLTFLLRLVPLNVATVSYILGAADVRPGRFLLGTLGILPAHFVTVYTGVVASHVTRMAATGHTGWTVEGVASVIGLISCAGVLVYVGRLVQRAIAEATEWQRP